MSAALHPVGPHTVEEWLALPPSEDGSRTELILGHFHVSPAPSYGHQLVAFELAVQIRNAIRAAGRNDLRAVPAVNVKISSASRTGLIPDVVIVDRQADVAFPAEAILLAVEVWSPGNTRAERDAKTAAYASAGVPYVWTIDQKNDLHELKLTAQRLNGEHYVVEQVVHTAGPVTIMAAPVPITVDLTDLVF
ncbi:Uma2 family endonuclease [Saccharothrix ecbatanensis]|uniref:Uma2 family endonuclease n=1 Tax=Saccharothrix ecbatanensis TaxID=1105145 RepID=A0A7W9HQG2_9PSEU|nr:Uma2 family endonuclease [Saccharothrix ecbatanensis]MBB5806183.1 Uma2 family endonuclease [Saccharothrix ecbatanensis]